MFRHHLLLALLLAAPPVTAQTPFVAIPPERAAAYRIDFRKFYPSADAETEDRTQTYARLKELRQLTGKVGATPENLLHALRLNETVTSRFNRHIIYRQLLFAVNTNDAASRQQSTTLQADLDAGVAFVRPEIAAISDNTLRSFIARRHELAAYAFVIERMRRNREHMLTAKEEAILARAVVRANDWPAQLYRQAASRATAGTVDVAGKPTSIAALANHPDAAVREAAWKKRSAGYDAQRDLFALALVQLAAGRNEVATQHGFRNAAEEVHADLFLDSRDVAALYQRILARGELNRRYQRAIGANIMKTTGVPSLAVWNQGLSDPNTKGARFPIDEATRLMDGALTAFGPEVRSAMNAILDPANGRLDIAAGPGRAPGAFAWGVPGLMTTFVYQSGYSGTYRDFTALFHEASHALHGQLVGENKALVSGNMGPPYLSEGFAMFFELLLNDHMLRTETDSARRVLLKEQFLWRTMLTFNLVRQAAVERAIYEGVQGGSLNTADNLDSLTVAVGRPVSIWYELHPEMKNDWSTVAQYVNSPLYMPNFAYASVLGLTLFQQYSANPKEFMPRFLALMKGGYSAPPAVLLKGSLGIDLTDPVTVDAAMTLLETRLKDLEAAYGLPATP